MREDPDISRAPGSSRDPHSGILLRDYKIGKASRVRTPHTRYGLKPQMIPGRGRSDRDPYEGSP